VEQRIALREAIAGLTDKQREALELWLCDYTQEEIAEIVGTTQQAVSLRITEAMSGIQHFME
jgi:RNA polymerase sigma factor (sigma-70 family)